MVATTKEKAHARNGKPEADKSALVIEVKFGRMSEGGRFVSLPLTIRREVLDLETAAANLVCRRLTGSILARPAGASALQGGIPGLSDGADVMLAGVFTVGRFAVGKKVIATKLTFEIPALPKDQIKLFRFAGRSGLLTIESAEDLEARQAVQPAAARGDVDGK
jgi:hypothetical protein